LFVSSPHRHSNAGHTAQWKKLGVRNGVKASLNLSLYIRSAFAADGHLDDHPSHGLFDLGSDQKIGSRTLRIGKQRGVVAGQTYRRQVERQAATMLSDAVR